MANSDPESQRLAAADTRTTDWRRWGTYLPERQWGTVREDYSPDGESWTYLSHSHARSRAYRWGEDGLLGWTDRKCRLAFSLALWNGRDPILKERLFGLTNPEGNHGEDVKELYYYLDATPTHSFCRGLYKYPIAEFPYEQLRKENARRGYDDPEFELLDTGVFANGRYFDVDVRYAKAGPNDTLIRVSVTNRSTEKAALTVLGQFVFRNTWRWGCTHEGCTPRPTMRLDPVVNGVATHHTELGKFYLNAEEPDHWLFTENETNAQSLWGTPNPAEYCKDAFHRYVVEGDRTAVNPQLRGTKSAAVKRLQLEPGETRELRFRMHRDGEPIKQLFGPEFDELFATRLAEANRYYQSRFPCAGGPEENKVHRQAIAGLLWTKQFYHYSVLDWMEGDPETPRPPVGRGDIRNGEWKHVFCRDVLSMPDKWEYPWFAAWDSAFHMIPFAAIDPEWTKDQLLLFLREWYLHPNGQIPAYEFNFSDVNPPVHAWAVREVYRKGPRTSADKQFMEQAFHKLLLNFTWWVNRKDPGGNNLFAGGFLGLDNIGPFDRSHPPEGIDGLEQADGTAWMAFNCGVMLDIALRMARHRPAYDGIASKFFEHFMHIADAMNHLGGSGMWDEEDGFYYDHIRCGDQTQRLKIRSIVGLIPLFAAVIVYDDVVDGLDGFKTRAKWFMKNRRDILQGISWRGEKHGVRKHLLAIPNEERLQRVLRYVFDENEFFSPYGVRSLSKVHEKKPFKMDLGGQALKVGYLPAESDSWLFGGNSNWRGPIWFPVNYLLVESLRTYGRFYGDELKVEVPTGSGIWMTLDQAADELAWRLTRLFLPGADGARPCHGADAPYKEDPSFRDLVLFYEYFHADTGRGCGASHQTGWTALVASLLSSLTASDSMRSREKASHEHSVSMPMYRP